MRVGDTRYMRIYTHTRTQREARDAADNGRGPRYFHNARAHAAEDAWPKEAQSDACACERGAHCVLLNGGGRVRARKIIIRPIL